MNYNQDPNQINDKGHLEIDGLDAVELANQYGTPLLIYNLSTVRDNINKYKRKAQNRLIFRFSCGIIKNESKTKRSLKINDCWN